MRESAIAGDDKAFASALLNAKTFAASQKTFSKAEVKVIKDLAGNDRVVLGGYTCLTV